MSYFDINIHIIYFILGIFDELFSNSKRAKNENALTQQEFADHLVFI